MSAEDYYGLELESETYSSLCESLNKTPSLEGAIWLPSDIFCGAFRFSDEYPRDVAESGRPELISPLTGLLRYLWAYRTSLVVGKPRSQFAAAWERTKTLAPLWAGFSPERYSSKMLPIVECMNLINEDRYRKMDEFEARLNEQQMRKRGES